VRKYIRNRKDHGANLIEFAILAPFLLLLLFGTIEFAWLFSQNLDVRHGAREGARLIAVNYPVGPVNPPPARTSAQTTLIVAEICNRMDVTTGALTGFIDWAIPSGLRLVSEVEIRVEQPAGWENTTDQPCP
jgi:Flp pilus assembly protein TadG